MNKTLYKQIFKTIKSFQNIVIARHIGVDPDAMASQMALKRSIEETFKDKNVYAVGNGTIRFNYMGKLDKNVDFSKIDNILLIVVDTPDRKRIDLGELNHYEASIKIDHHPFIEKACDIEYIDDSKSSASEMIYDMILETKMVINKEIANLLFCGIVSDTNRFLFNNAKATTFQSVAEMITNFDLDITKNYQNLYNRPFLEMQLLGYMALNMQITPNKVGYIKVANEIISKYQVDTVSCGSLINEFNYIEEILVWLTATEDLKNNCIRISIRSRGPVINKIAEHYNGGGHRLASGARVSTWEEVDSLIKELDKVSQAYLESEEVK